MSRNLCRTDCAFCSGLVVLEEEARPVRPDEVGVYFGEYKGMLVALSHCEDCEAKYLAWMNEKTKVGQHHFLDRGPREDGQHFDLSHRSTFNDEPWIDDYPKYRIKMVKEREPWPTCSRCGGPRSGRSGDYDCERWHEHLKEDEAVANSLMEDCAQPPLSLRKLDPKKKDDRMVIADWLEEKGYVYLCARIRGEITGWGSRDGNLDSKGISEPERWLGRMGFIVSP